MTLCFPRLHLQRGSRAGSLLLERQGDAEGSCSEGGGGIAQECNHGFGVEEGLSWLAKLAGGCEGGEGVGGIRPGRENTPVVWYKTEGGKGRTLSCNSCSPFKAQPRISGLLTC